MQKTIILVALVGFVGVAVAQPLTELKFNVANFNTEQVDCNSKVDVIDECGLQQGFSNKYSDFAYPTNQTFLMSSCKRQTDAFKCLKAHAKCLPPLSKQVLIAMVNSRQKYNKKICSEKQSESATKVIELAQCMNKNKAVRDRVSQAELAAITSAEAILNSKIDSIEERIKHSCCSTAKVHKDFMDATIPECKQYSQVASEMIDSYIADTVGIICPDFESNKRQDCAKLPELVTPKTSTARFFVRPILSVVQTLQA